MIVNYREDYRPVMIDGLNLLATINKIIAQKECYLGNSPELDILYMRVTVISALIDRLMEADEEFREIDKSFLLCLRKLVSKKNELCYTKNC
jgi:hypothetical protein